jgi:hypothetical protein
VVEEAALGDDQRQAGLAWRGVAIAVPTEAARRALAALTRAVAPPKDRCGGGKQRYTAANLRLGERGTPMLAAAEDCWKLYVHGGRTRARDTAECMGKAGSLLMACQPRVVLPQGPGNGVYDRATAEKARARGEWRETGTALPKGPA